MGSKSLFKKKKEAQEKNPKKPSWRSKPWLKTVSWNHPGPPTDLSALGYFQKTLLEFLSFNCKSFPQTCMVCVSGRVNSGCYLAIV